MPFFKKQINREEIFSFHEQVKNHKHVFVYGVGGRSSSTALQRILNSSNEICVYGEPHLIIDDILTLKERMKIWDKKQKKRDQIGDLKKCFKKDKHDLWYANALKDLDPYIDMVSATVSHIFKPIIEVERFGFKAIRIQSIKTLEGIRKLYPNSIIIFLFRNPLRQWPSAKEYIPQVYENDLSLFLKEYKRIAEIYLKFKNNNENCILVENIALFKTSKVQKMMNVLALSNFDHSLTEKVIKSTKKIIEKKEEEVIVNSAAYKFYKQMLEQADFKD